MRRLSGFLLFIIMMAIIDQAQLSAQEELSACPSVCCGKIDLAAAYVHIDVLQNGKTHHRIDLPAIKTDLSYNIWRGILLKPNFMYGRQGNSHITTGGIGLGFCGKINECLTIIPFAGVNWGYLRTQFKEKIPETPLGPLHPKIHERFRSRSPYIAVEVCYKFLSKWRIVGCYQYSWSRTHTHLRGVFPDLFRQGVVAAGGRDPGASSNTKGSTQGSSYSGLLEYDINEHWSVNIGAAYNVSLSKEKHGLRGYGCKVGMGYWF